MELGRPVLSEWPTSDCFFSWKAYFAKWYHQQRHFKRFLILLPPDIFFFIFFKVNLLKISGVSYGHIVTEKTNIWFWKWGRVGLTVAFAKTWWTWGSKLVLLARMWTGAALALRIRTVEVLVEPNDPKFGRSLFDLDTTHLIVIDAFRQIPLFHVSICPHCLLSCWFGSRVKAIPFGSAASGL